MADSSHYEEEIASLKGKILLLQEEKDGLDARNNELLREVSDLQSEVEEMEERRDNAIDHRDEAVASLRDEKGRELALLLRLEFCLNGLCPICKGLLEHKVGCDMKLAIFRVDHELARRTFENSVGDY